MRLLVETSPLISAVRRTAHGLSWVLLLGCLGLGCSRSATDEIEVLVSRVALDPASQSPVVLLEDRDHRVALPIWIGPFEARAIAMQLDGVEAPRPMTHDLMKNVLNEIGVELERVVIGDLRENTYHASLVLRWQGREFQIDSRPSDAIALAVRFEQPIFVAAPLLEGENAIVLAAEPVPPVTLGGVTVQILSGDLAEHFQVPNGRGVLVSQVSEAGVLRRGDVILEVDGETVIGPEDLREKLRPAGRRVDLLVHRDGVRLHLPFHSDALD